MQQQLIGVRILSAPLQIDHAFTYLKEASLEDVQKGDFVKVPFGRGNREAWAVVMDPNSTYPDPSKLKSVVFVLDHSYALSEEQLGLCLFLEDYYLCTLGDAIRCVLPTAVFSTAAHNIRYRVFYELTPNVEDFTKAKTSMQRQILAYLKEHGKQPKDLLIEALQGGESSLRTLAQYGYIQETREEVYRNPYTELSKERDTAPIHLTQEQLQAFEVLKDQYGKRKASAALLFGITGSGKTKVLMRLIDEVLEDGRNVLMMVPEIALTPQTLRLFCSRYGEEVAVIHSSLSDGERFDAWRRIQKGMVRLVIGTRSAVMAPLPNIGLFIVDEEHEHTYKSDMDPKYHVKQVCSFRCSVHQALTVFTSATPSLESYKKAMDGKYTLVTLKNRFGGATLPQVQIVDMRKELQSGNTSTFSKPLYKAMQETHEMGEQAILFLNHRGYHSTMHCKTCGEVLNCPHCSVSLTYHVSPSPILMCHLCGYRQPVPKACPSCNTQTLQFLGSGTQKVEEDLQKFFPASKVVRMDADTTTKKDSYEEILGAFRRGEADVLLGTQMVTKGHDFPQVTLVGIMLADIGLYAADYRAAERTYSLITQVIGRAGRAQKSGRAIIQTFSPDSPLLKLAKEQRYEEFFRQEIEMRRVLSFPPFVDLVECTYSAQKEELLIEDVARELEYAKTLLQTTYKDLPMELYGPLQPPIYLEKNTYRLKLLFKCHWTITARSFFKELLLYKDRSGLVSASIDLNPQ